MTRADSWLPFRHPPDRSHAMAVAPMWLCLVVTTAWIYASVVSAALSLEWPYSELLADLTAQTERCSKVSGFQFRKGSSPNAQQLANMCADPDCIAVTSKLLNVGGKDPSTHPITSTFVEPVLDYCWYLREPGAPCPEDRWGEFLSHVKDRDANCARVMGYSFVDPKMKTLSETATCPPDCLPLAVRLFYLWKYMPCPMRYSEQVYFDTAKTLAFMSYCAKGEDTNKVEFAYWPGWPLPPKTTAVVPTPSPSPSPAPASTSEEIMPDATSSADENTPTPSATNTTRAPTTLAPISSGSREENQQDAAGSFAVIATPTPLGTATVSPLLGDFAAATQLPGATVNPDRENSKTTPTGKILYVTVASAVGVVFLIAIFIYMRRRRSEAPSKSDEKNFAIIATPSTANGTEQLTTRAAHFDGDNDAMATITKVIPVKHIQDIRMIGTGGYGVVFLVRDTLNDRLLASKRLIDTKRVTNDKIDGFFREIQLVSTLNHPCIVTFIGATWTSRTDVQALFEYMDGGDLRTYLDNTPVPVTATIQATQHTWTIEKLSIAIDIADALDYVHSTRDRDTPLVHRDLKSRNVLLSKSPRRAKLSDFGVSRELSHNMSMTDGVGTSRWLAPEVILGGGDYGTACDVYSFGVVLSELDTHKLPFWDCGGGDGGGGVEVEGMDSVLPEIAILRMVAMEGRQPSFSGTCPPKLLELARQCLSHNPSERPTAATIAKTLREFPLL